MKYFIQIVFLLFFSLSAYTQEKEVWSIDLDLGLSFLDAEHIVPNPIPPALVPMASTYKKLFVTGFGSFTIYGRIKYISPNWSVGFFVKPGVADNVHKNVAQTTNGGNWIFLQCPIGIATELGKTDMHSPGIIAGAGFSYNYYEFTHTKIPSFQKIVPYFFVQIHKGSLGIRFSTSPNQTYSYSDGAVTKTHLDFTATFLATVPVIKKNTN